MRFIKKFSLEITDSKEVGTGFNALDKEYWVLFEKKTFSIVNEPLKSLNTILSRMIHRV